MKCKNCGATLDEGALFCRKCGAAVSNTPAPKKTASNGRKPFEWKKLLSFATDRFRDLFAKGKAAIEKLLKNKRFLLTVGIAVALLIVLIVVIASAASCRKNKTGFSSSDEAVKAATEALQNGDGERLYRLTALSAPLLGAHPEQFGEGDTPEAVMKGYYARLADDLKTDLSERYGKRFKLDPVLTAEVYDGTNIFETNRALGIEAETYMVESGFLSVDGEGVTDVYLVTANVDGEWKLIVLYLSEYPNK